MVWLKAREVPACHVLRNAAYPKGAVFTAQTIDQYELTENTVYDRRQRMFCWAKCYEPKHNSLSP